MPELGGFRRRLADQAKQMAQEVSQAGMQHLEQFAPQSCLGSGVTDWKQ